MLKLMELQMPGGGVVVVHADHLYGVMETPRAGELDIYCAAFPAGLTVQADLEELVCKWHVMTQEELEEE